jgi:hypothetical protein
MCTSISEPQYGQDKALVSGRGVEEDDTTTGFRRSSIRDGSETPAVLTLFDCTRSQTTTSIVTHIKDFDIFMHNIKD